MNSQLERVSMLEITLPDFSIPQTVHPKKEEAIPRLFIT
jgi:hypothetical protein